MAMGFSAAGAPPGTAATGGVAGVPFVALSIFSTSFFAFFSSSGSTQLDAFVVLL